MEDPTEEIHKKLHEEAEHSHNPGIMKIALTSALLAVFAASASLLSEHQSNEAMLDQLKASDNWNYYQAKGIKSTVLESQTELLKALQKPIDPSTADKIKKYKEEQAEISKTANEQQEASQKHLSAHNALSFAVTTLQVAIGVSAISALTRRRWLWFTSIALGLGGIGLLVWGILRMAAI